MVTETRAIQEGSQTSYGQAHLPFDPPEQDGGLDSWQVMSEGQGQSDHVIERSRPSEPLQSMVLSDHPMHQIAPVPNFQQHPLRPQIHLLQDQQPVNEGPYAQSVSGFTDPGMNLPSTGHLRQLPSDLGIASPPPRYILTDLRNVQPSDRQQEQHGGGANLQARPEFEPQETLSEQEGTTRPFQTASAPRNTTNGPNSVPESIPQNTSHYMTANNDHVTRDPIHTSEAQPMHFPHFKEGQQRRQTFHNWPRSSSQRPEHLVEAGLFYTGNRDQCCCFYCGGMLRQWKDDDNAMEQHTLWYPDCPFVRARNRETAVKSEAVRDVEETMKNLSIKEKEQTLVEQMGFKRTAVRRAIEKIGREADVNMVIEYLLANPGDSESNDALPPEMNPKICKVCTTEQANVTQLKCGHIVCKSCATRRHHTGKFVCGICQKEVTSTVPIDNSVL